MNAQLAADEVQRRSHATSRTGAALRGCRLGAHEQKAANHRPKANAVDPKRRRGTQPRHQAAGKRRAQHAANLQNHRIQIDRAAYFGHAGQIAKEGLLGGKVDRCNSAKTKREHINMPELREASLEQGCPDTRQRPKEQQRQRVQHAHHTQCGS